MITAEIILDTRRRAKKGYPVKIRVYDNLASKSGASKFRQYINLNIYQDFDTLKLTSELKRRDLDLSDQVKYCNENLLSLDESIKIITNGVPVDDLDMEIQILEKRLELLRQKKGIVKEIGLIEFTTVLLNERRVHKKPTRSFTALIDRINEFNGNKDIPLNSINKEWINALDLYYKDKGLKDTSIYTYVALIKAVYKEAQTRESLNVKQDNPFRSLRVFQRDKKETTLKVEDLSALINIKADDIKRGNKERYLFFAGLFPFQFAIGGHDLIDVAVMKWGNISKGRIKFKRYKNRFKASKGEEVDNMLNDYALNFIERFGDKNSERIFTQLPDPVTEFEKYRSAQININSKTIPKLSEIIKLKDKFSTKSTRYLFRTSAGNLLIDSYVIMKLQGHTPKGVTFGYQGALNYEVQDREHKKILDLVFK